MLFGNPPKHSVWSVERFEPFFFSLDVLNVPGSVDEVSEALQVSPLADIHDHVRVGEESQIGMVFHVAN